MRYVNANTVLPASLIAAIQQYYQGGCLYIPSENHRKNHPTTEYSIELEKRNQHIYLKHLEGRPNRVLAVLYHLSESSIRRIVARERIHYQNMKETIRQLLPLWGITDGRLTQIYPSAWTVGDTHVLKVYHDRQQLERNIHLSTVLLHCGIPVAEIICTEDGGKYVSHQNAFFLLSKKLPGSNITDLKDQNMARKMGCAIARLHLAFLQCEKEITFWDNSFLEEMKGWVQENLRTSGWQPLSEAAYLAAVSNLEQSYDQLPRQLIHRDVHFGNFLFLGGNFSGYIDFDLSQKNIRIFDICYFLTGLLAEETAEPITKAEWLGILNAVITGYESITKLTGAEKNAVFCVMQCIEILFVAYFTGIGDVQSANGAYRIFHFIQDCENECPFI